MPLHRQPAPLVVSSAFEPSGLAPARPTDWMKMADREGTSAATYEDLYNSDILRLVGNMPRIGRLPAPDATSTLHSRMCGSTVTVDFEMNDGIVSDFAMEAKACALGQAAAAIVAANIVGASRDEIVAAREAMWAMLKENGAPPTGRFSELRLLESVRNYPSRHPAVMLIFDAVIDAMSQIAEGSEAAHPA